MSDLIDCQTKGNISVITINNPPVNAMSVNKGVPQGILDAIKAGEHDINIKAFLLIGGGHNFCGGADISEFGGDYDPQFATLMNLIEYMDTVTKPIFGALSGPTMGGGLELAMACHYRSSSQGALLGLPEVKLGIMPGAGGTQRLPRLVDGKIALEMMLTGNPIGPERAKELGLVDVVFERDLLTESLSWINSQMKSEIKLRRTRDLGVLGEINFDAEKARVREKWRGYPAPLEIIVAVETGFKNNFQEGIDCERKGIQKLMDTNESASLRHLFFSERRASKIPGLRKKSSTERINKVAVLGAGTMGGGIAMNFANAGIPVTVVEVSEDNLRVGMEVIKKNYASTVSKGRMSQFDMDRTVSLITPSTDLEVVADADIVVEAVFEDMKLKKQIFGQLDEMAKEDAILATNTSTLDVNEIAAITKRPSSVIGTHFFSPANVMRLLEVVRGDKTSDEVLATTMSLGKRINKVPVCVGVCDGFVGNRMIHHYIREAGFLIEEGALPQQVDKAIESFGFAMGPFRMSDLAGLDIGWAIRKRQSANRPVGERYSRIADLICEMGRFGQKTRAGFYRYADSSRVAIKDEEIEKLIVEESANLNIDRRDFTNEEIIKRLLYALINEGAKILDEKIATRSSDIDVIYAHGYGFPRYRGGPMFYADHVGLSSIVESINLFKSGYRADHWVVAPLLQELASRGSTFAQWAGGK